MAKIINIDTDKSEFIKNLQKAIQSANLNFIIGSGCSNPALLALGNVEQEVQKLLEENKNGEADQKLAEFLKPFVTSAKQLIDNTLDENHKTTQGYYNNFIQIISQILFERKSNILHNQVTIFSTNYDLFIEKSAAELFESLILNDGFHRSPSLTNTCRYSPKEFFNTVFNTGNLYNYQVQVPSINLIKLHGSLNWQAVEGAILQSIDYLKKAEGLKDKTEADKITEFIELFSLVLPKKDKFKETILNQTYYDLLRIYSNELDKENTLLITEGFSFADEHILDLTKRALKNPTLKLVVFCYETSSVEYENKFAPFNNVDIVYSEKESIDFASFNSILTDILPQKVEPPVYKVEIKDSADE